MVTTRLHYKAVQIAALVLSAACAADSRPDGAAPATHMIPPDFAIGLVEGDSAYLFGDIVSVAADDSGRTYVGDRIGATVRAYDGSGQYLKRIAREGRGPGEIHGWPADITVGPEGSVVVRDASRITVFSTSAPGGTADSLAATWPLQGYGNLSSTRSRVGEAGEYYYPGYTFRDGELPRFYYVPYRDGATTNDTLNVPPYPRLSGLRRASYRTGSGGGRLLDGLSHVPFAALPVWDVTNGGTILSSSGSEYVIVETNVRGDTIRVIQGPTTDPVPIPMREKADSTRALNARLDTLPVPINDVIGIGEGVRERRLPAVLPAMLNLHVGSDGLLWVERWPEEGQAPARFYDVLDQNGDLRARVILQAPLTRDPPPFFGARHAVGVIRDSDTGIQRVVRFTLPASLSRSVLK